MSQPGSVIAALPPLRHRPRYQPITRSIIPLQIDILHGLSARLKELKPCRRERLRGERASPRCWIRWMLDSQDSAALNPEGEAELSVLVPVRGRAFTGLVG